MTKRESIKCPVCDNPSAFWTNLPEVDLHFCPACKHRCTNPKSIKNPEEYSQDYFEESHKNWFENPDINLFQSIINHIDNKLGDKDEISILDVGCGNGAFLKYVKSIRPEYKLCGIDYHENEIEEGINYIQGDIFDHSFESKFDVVTNLAVIEHIWDVQAFSAKLCDLVDKDGIVATMTINDEGLIYKIARWLRFIFILFPMIRLYDKHHINHFGIRSLANLLEKNGHVVSVHKPHPLQFAAIDMNPDQSIILRILVKYTIFILIGVEKLTKMTTSQLIFTRPK